MLFTATCHAGWNASIKRTLDPLATTVLIAIGAGLVALPGILTPAGPICSWPWLIGLDRHPPFHQGLIECYRVGDLGQVYPIARGAAPLMTATMTTIFVGERLGLYGCGGIVLLAAGVLSVVARRARPRQARPRGSRLSPFYRGDGLRLFGGGRHRGPGGGARQSHGLFRSSSSSASRRWWPTRPARLGGAAADAAVLADRPLVAARSRSSSPIASRSAR